MDLEAAVNRGLSPELKSAFPNTVSVQRPLVKNPQILDPPLPLFTLLYYINSDRKDFLNPPRREGGGLAGFTCAAGCFDVNIIKSPSLKSQPGGG